MACCKASQIAGTPPMERAATSSGLRVIIGWGFGSKRSDSERSDHWRLAKTKRRAAAAALPPLGMRSPDEGRSPATTAGRGPDGSAALATRVAPGKGFFNQLNIAARFAGERSRVTGIELALPTSRLKARVSRWALATTES